MDEHPPTRPHPVDPRARFRTLPARVLPADTVPGHDPFPPPDPTAGRDPERDAMLRVAGL